MPDNDPKDMCDNKSPYCTFRRVVSESDIDRDTLNTSGCDVWNQQSNAWGDECCDADDVKVSIDAEKAKPPVDTKEDQVDEPKKGKDDSKREGKWQRPKRRHFRKPVAHSLDEYISLLHHHKRPFIDFTIDKSAMCETMSNGELCTRRCSSIHVQRCSHGDNCRSRMCTYMHAKDMANEQAANRFRETQEEYDNRSEY